MVRHGEMVSKANNSRVASAASSSEDVGDIPSPQGLVSFDHSLSMQETTPSSSRRSELLQPPKLVSGRSGAASSPKHKRHYSLFDFSTNSKSRTLGINNNILVAAVHDDTPDYNMFGNRIEDLDLRDVPNKSLPSTSPAGSCSSHDHQLRNASAAAPESSHVKISSRKSRDWKRLLPFNPDSLYYHIHHSSRSRPKVEDQKLLARGNSDSKLLVDLQVESDQLQNNNNNYSEKKFMGAAAGVSAGSASAHFTSLGVSVSSELLGAELKTTAGGTKQGVLELPELAARWREIQGSKDWAGLLDPLDLDLRKEIIRYGEFAQMTYDNFDSDSHSKYAGSARFAKQELFERVHNNSSTCGKYQVTRYLYSAVADQNLASLPAETGYKPRRSPADQAWDLHSNWIGFVAVSIDAEEIRRLGRRDVVIAWRGTTVGSLEWFKVAEHASWQLQTMAATMTHRDELAAKTAQAHDQPPPTPQGGRSDSSKCVLQRPKVVKGFWSLYTSKLPHSNFNQDSPSEQVIGEVRRLLELYKGEELSITITGHGLGGALAILSAYEIGETRLNQQLDKNYGLVELADNIPVTVITFGSPCIGDSIFKSRFEELQLKALRVVNVHDLVPKSIGGKLQPPWGSSYKHVGVELQVNHKLSTYMKHTRDPSDWHNLECYLHLVDGFQGFKSNEFRLVTDRDYSLINKSSNVLKDEYCIPGFWWQLENKGLIRNSAGRWVQPNRPPKDDPTLANRDQFI